MEYKLEEHLNMIQASLEQEPGNTVLVLGPDVVRHQGNNPFQHHFIQHLKKQAGNYIEKVDTQEGVVLLKEIFLRNTLASKVRSYFSGPADPIYEKIAQIPFSLLINLSPGTHIVQAYEAGPYSHSYTHYDRSKPLEIEQISKDKPLIFNLFGQYDNAESLLLTHQDIFVFLKSMLAERPLPTGITSILRDASYILFVGVPLDKWYFRFLLRILKLDEHQSGPKCAFYPSLQEEVIKEKKLDELTHQLYKKLFRIEVKPMSSALFIEQLHEALQKVDGLKKADEQVEESIIDQLRNLLTKNQYQEFLDLAGSYIHEKSYVTFNQLISSLESQLTRLQRRRTMNPDAVQSNNAQENSFVEALTVFIEQLETREKSEPA